MGMVATRREEAASMCAASPEVMRFTKWRTRLQVLAINETRNPNVLAHLRPLYITKPSGVKLCVAANIHRDPLRSMQLFMSCPHEKNGIGVMTTMVLCWSFLILGRVVLQLVKENTKRRTHGRHDVMAGPPLTLCDNVLVSRIFVHNDCFRTTAPLHKTRTLSDSRNEVLPIYNQADGFSLRKTAARLPSTTRLAVFATAKCGRAPT